MKFDKRKMTLYAVTDRSWLKGESLYEQVRQAISGGVTFVQLREKDLDGDSFLKEAMDIKELCLEHNIPFVINDNVEIAKKINADGVHIGQEDMMLADARAILGEDKIIGVSVQTVAQAVAAERDGADYLGVGAVFPTSSKADAESVSIDVLRQICGAVDIPVVAIGGINAKNAEKLKGSGIDGIAVISGIFSKDDIKSAACELKRLADEVTEND